MKRKLSRYGLLFMLPGLIGFILFVLVPVMFTIRYAALDGNGRFRLFSNAISLFQADAFLQALRNTTLYLIVGSGTAIACALLFAMALFVIINHFPGLVSAIRTCYLIPMVIPSSICVLFAHMIFSNGGFINRLSGAEIDYLRTAPYTFWILVVVYVYKNTGYFTLIFLIAFAGIEKEVYEAAKCDGARTFTLLGRIMIPQIVPSFFFIFIMSIVNVFKMSRESYLLFGDYPNVSAYMFQNFIKNNLDNLNYSRAATASLLLLLVFSVLVGFMINLSEEGGGRNA